MKEENTNKETKKKTNKWSLLGWIWRVLLFIILLLLVFSLLIRIPAIQDWGSDVIASNISKRLNTEVKVDGFTFRSFDELRIRGLLIRDLEKDTLLYAEILSADFDKPFVGLLNGELIIEEMYLKNALLNVKHRKDDDVNNLVKLLSGRKENEEDPLAISLEEEETKSGTIFKLARLELENTRFRNLHEIKGKEELFHIQNAQFLNARINDSIPEIKTDELLIDGLLVDIENFVYDEDRYHTLYVEPWLNDSTALENPFPFALFAVNLDLANGRFKLQNFRKAPIKLTTDNQLDLRHLDVGDIRIDADSFYMYNWNFGGILHLLQAKSKSGFSLEQVKASRVAVSEKQVLIDDLDMITNSSKLNGDLQFEYGSYPDFKDFEDLVSLNLNMDNTRIALNDIMEFAPKLRDNSFFADNGSKQIYIDGRIFGRINSLKGRNLSLSLGEFVRMNGTMDIRNVTDPDNTVVNLNLRSMETDVLSLRTLIPGINLPPNFDNLGKLNFSGQFDGLLRDFVAFGKIRSDIGLIESDMRLNIIGGNTQAVYSGQLKLIDFDLGKWMNNSDFGLISFESTVSDGRGLSAEVADADLTAIIRSLQFKDYYYTNAIFRGKLNKSLINGNFEIDDTNIGLSFEGIVEFNDHSPHIDAKGRLDHIDLQALNLSESPFQISTDFDINIRDLDPDRFVGMLDFRDVHIEGSEEQHSTIDSLLIQSRIIADSQKFFTVSSDLLELKAEGKFRILGIANSFQNYFNRNHPSFANKLKIRNKEIVKPAQFDLELNIKNSLSLLRLINPEMDTIRDFNLSGTFDDFTETYRINASVPWFKWKDREFTRLSLYANGDGGYDNFILSHEGLNTDKLKFAPLNLFLDLEKDTARMVVNEVDFESFVDNVNIEGKVFLSRDDWQMELYNSNLQMFGQEWQVNESNYVRFGKPLIVNDLKLFSGEEFIRLASINNNQGLELLVNAFPMDRINSFMNYDKIRFGGILEGEVYINDFEQNADLDATFYSEELLINGDSFGEFNFLAISKDIKSPIEVAFDLSDSLKQMKGEGTVYLKNKDIPGSRGRLEAHVDVVDFPLAIFEYFITKGLSNTSGTFDGRIEANGLLSDPELSGLVEVDDGSFKIDILGTTYFIRDQEVNINSDMIDATGVQISDRFGNLATIEGGLTHHNLAGIGLRARIRSDEMLMLETTKSDNPIYYGTCFGSVDARFMGPMNNQPRIIVDATNTDNTYLFINNDYERQSGGLDFIDFQVDTSTRFSFNRNLAPTGVDFILNLSANPLAEVQIIFDEQTRDIIKGRGNGDLVLRYSPAGELSLFGDFNITSGEYLFTNNFGPLLINKPFTIESGSFIQWSGDPFNAIVNINAKYKGVKAAPYNLLDNLGEQQDVIEEAQLRTDVHLSLLLTGRLLHPDINFDIEIPELSSKLRSQVDSKLAYMKQDQNEMNRQAASLIVFGDFVPITLSASSSISAVANTVSEWLSTQISYYLSGIVAEVIQGVDFIDDIQFDVGYRVPYSEYVQTGNFDFQRSQIDAGTKVIMFNRRVELDIEGNYINNKDQIGLIPDTYFNSNVELEYILTRDRRWRIRAYTKSDYISLGRRYKHGIGLTWKREYDRLDEFKNKVRQLDSEIKDKKEDSR